MKQHRLKLNTPDYNKRRIPANTKFNGNTLYTDVKHASYRTSRVFKRSRVGY